MSFFDKFSADKLKDAAAVAKKKLGDAAAKGAEAATAASQMVKDFDYQEAQATAKRTRRAKLQQRLSIQSWNMTMRAPVTILQIRPSKRAMAL